jgi:hypothetical protein
MDRNLANNNMPPVIVKIIFVAILPTRMLEFRVSMRFEHRLPIAGGLHVGMEDG